MQFFLLSFSYLFSMQHLCNWPSLHRTPFQSILGHTYIDTGSWFDGKSPDFHMDLLHTSPRIHHSPCQCNRMDSDRCSMWCDLDMSPHSDRGSCRTGWFCSDNSIQCNWELKRKVFKKMVENSKKILWGYKTCKATKVKAKKKCSIKSFHLQNSSRKIWKTNTYNLNWRKNVFKMIETV